MLLEMTMPPILNSVFIVVAIGLIGLQLKADILVRIEYHGGGKRHGHLPIAPIQIKVASCSDIEIHTARRIVVIAIPGFLRSSPRELEPTAAGRLGEPLR